MPGLPPTSVLDRQPARWLAAAVLAGAVAVIAVHHRDDLFPSERVATSDNPALDRCLTTRFGDIDRMVSDGLIGQIQAGSFRRRAEAMCRDITAWRPTPQGARSDN